MNYWKTYFRTLLKIGLPLFGLTIVGTLLDQWLTGQMEALLMSPQGTGKLVWFYGGISLVWGVIYPLMGLLLILSTLQPLPFLTFWRRSFPQALIELMRAWGKSMLWSFLLILPGIVRFVRYLFVPFIVCLDPEYQSGDREALLRSRELSKGRLGKLFGLFLLSSVFIPGLMTAFDEWKIFSMHPLSASFLCFMEMILNLCFSLWLWKIYQRSVQV